MDKLSKSRLASGLIILVGIWLMLTPVFISMTGAALVNILIVGGLITLAGLIQLFWVNSLPSWVTAIVAIWLFISAFAFSVSSGAAWNIAIFAIITFLLATWDGVEMGEFERQHHLGF
jgi:hypothetical protein